MNGSKTSSAAGPNSPGSSIPTANWWKYVIRPRNADCLVPAAHSMAKTSCPASNTRWPSCSRNGNGEPPAHPQLKAEAEGITTDHVLEQILKHVQVSAEA